MFLLFFFTDNNESCESLWNRVCVKEPDGLREEALPQSLCLCHQAPEALLTAPIHCRASIAEQVM